MSGRCPHIPVPSQEEVDLWHMRYTKGLAATFEQWILSCSVALAVVVVLCVCHFAARVPGSKVSSKIFSKNVFTKSLKGNSLILFGGRPKPADHTPSWKSSDPRLPTDVSLMERAAFGRAERFLKQEASCAFMESGAEPLDRTVEWRPAICV